MRKTDAKKNRFKNVRLLILDVDGVLTRGEIIYDNEGRELKIFNVKDGLGISLLQRCGIKTVLLTARSSEVVEKRARDMRVSEVIGNTLPKSSVLPGIMKKYEVGPEQVCFVGDDLIDTSIMKEVGLPVAVKDAPPEVKRHARYITRRAGGDGAVREIAEIILKVQGLWKPLLRDFDDIVRTEKPGVRHKTAVKPGKTGRKKDV